MKRIHLLLGALLLSVAAMAYAQTISYFSSTGGSLVVNSNPNIPNSPAGYGSLQVTGSTTPLTTLNGGDVYATGNVLARRAESDSNTTVTAVTILGNQSGTVFRMTTNTGTAVVANKTTFNLPVPTVGMYFTFIDNDVTTNHFLWVTASTGVTINGGTAGKSYKCTANAVKQSTTLFATSTTSWEVISEVGTWANDNS